MTGKARGRPESRVVAVTLSGFPPQGGVVGGTIATVSGMR